MAKQINTNLSNGSFSFDNSNYSHNNEFNSAISGNKNGFSITNMDFGYDNDFNSGVSNKNQITIDSPDYSSSNNKEINFKMHDLFGNPTTGTNGKVDSDLNNASIFDADEDVNKTGANKTSENNKSDSDSSSKKNTESKKEENNETKNASNNYGGAATVPATPGIKLANKKAADGYGAPFLEKTKQIAAKYGMDYKELLALMNQESSLDAKQVTGSYVGLIQSGDDACATVGYTKQQVYNMTPMEQLDFVDKRIGYVQQHTYGGRQISAVDFYVANFLPARAHKEVLTRAGDHDYISKKTGTWRSYYDDNRGVDINGDGAITKTEMQQWINRKKVDESSFSG